MTSRPEPDAPAHVSAALDRLGLPLDEDYPVSKAAPAQPTLGQAEIEAHGGAWWKLRAELLEASAVKHAEYSAELRGKVQSALASQNAAEARATQLNTALTSLQAQLAAAMARDEAWVNDLPKPCDGKEQYAFEAWAKENHYDMNEHPLHYIFLDPKTNAARMGWNACIKYMRAALPAAAPDAQP